MRNVGARSRPSIEGARRPALLFQVALSQVAEEAGSGDFGLGVESRLKLCVAFIEFEGRADNLGIFNAADLRLQLGRIGRGVRFRVLNLALDVSVEGLRVVKMCGGLAYHALRSRNASRIVIALPIPKLADAIQLGFEYGRHLHLYFKRLGYQSAADGGGIGRIATGLILRC